MPRRMPLIVSFVLLIALLAPALVVGAAEPPPLPTSMAALGDSITTAYNTGPSAYRDFPANSWSTGTTPSVKSHNLRIASTGVTTFNNAVSGAKVIDLASQVTATNGQTVKYVTILIGGNDVCTRTEAAMTSVTEFRTRFEGAMQALRTGSPDANVYVVSIPNVWNLWNVLRTNGSARFAWAIFGICQSMLARPSSTAQADVDRRERVKRRNIELNAQLADVCANYVTYGGGTGICRYDNNSAFNTPFAASDVSTRDYFHPSLKGQTRLACVSWAWGYWGNPADAANC